MVKLSKSLETGSSSSVCLWLALVILESMSCLEAIIAPQKPDTMWTVCLGPVRRDELCAPWGPSSLCRGGSWGSVRLSRELTAVTGLRANTVDVALVSTSSLPSGSKSSRAAFLPGLPPPSTQRVNSSGCQGFASEKRLFSLFLPQIPERKQLSIPKIESPEGYYEEAEPYDTSLNGTSGPGLTREPGSGRELATEHEPLPGQGAEIWADPAPSGGSGWSTELVCVPGALGVPTGGALAEGPRALGRQGSVAG